MKTAIAVLLARPRKKLEDVDYYPGYHHLICSLKRHCKDLPPIVVISPDLKEKPPEAEMLVSIDPAEYDSINGVQMAFGKSVYFKLDLFRLNFDRVVYFDTDVLALDDVSDLWDPSQYNDHSLYAARESSQVGFLNPDWQQRLNSGVMVINQFLLNEETFRELMSLAEVGHSYDLSDQGVINAFVDRDAWQGTVGQLDPTYNLPSCAATHGDWETFEGRVKLLHFVGPRKPWRSTPDHEWHSDTVQALWDQEVGHHPRPPERRGELESSLHTKLVRVVQQLKVKWQSRQSS